MGIGFGMASAIRGAGEGYEDSRRREREDFQMEQAEKAAARTDTLFDQQQEDRAFGMPLKRKAMQRQDELGDIEMELKRNEIEISRLVKGARTAAAKAEAAGKLAELEKKNYGLVYDAFKTRGGKAAASLFNNMGGNDVKTAADFVVEVDPKTDKRILKVVDANGEVVSDSRLGPAVFDVAELEKVFGHKGEKGRFSESERGVTDTATGKFTPHGPGTPKDKVDPFEKELRAIIFPQWGSQLGDRFVFDGKNGEYANAHLTKAIELINQAPDGKRNAAKYAELAGKMIRVQKRRGEFRGELPGTGSGMFENFDPKAMASKMTELFPEGNEAEIRQFLTEKGIKDPARQDQVLQQMGVKPQSRGPVGAPPAAAPPAQALAGLKEGQARKFANGEVWTLKNGQPVRVK